MLITFLSDFLQHNRLMKPQGKNKRTINSTEIFVRRQSFLGLSSFVRTLQSGWHHSLMIDQQTDCFGIAQLFSYKSFFCSHMPRSYPCMYSHLKGISWPASNGEHLEPASDLSRALLSLETSQASEDEKQAGKKRESVFSVESHVP
jgi:hypothetical protein